MFKSVEDVNNANINTLVTLVREFSWKDGVSAILDQKLVKELKEAQEVVSKAEDLAAKIAFAIRNRVQEILDEEDHEDVTNEFMNCIAIELGQEYNGEYEYRPDYFWVQSTC